MQPNETASERSTHPVRPAGIGDGTRAMILRFAAGVPSGNPGGGFPSPARDHNQRRATQPITSAMRRIGPRRRHLTWLT